MIHHLHFRRFQRLLVRADCWEHLLVQRRRGAREEVHAAPWWTETEGPGTRLHVAPTHVRTLQPRGQERVQGMVITDTDIFSIQFELFGHDRLVLILLCYTFTGLQTTWVVVWDTRWRRLVEGFLPSRRSLPREDLRSCQWRRGNHTFYLQYYYLLPVLFQSFFSPLYLPHL